MGTSLRSCNTQQSPVTFKLVVKVLSYGWESVHRSTRTSDFSHHKMMKLDGWRLFLKGFSCSSESDLRLHEVGVLNERNEKEKCYQSIMYFFIICMHAKISQKLVSTFRLSFWSVVIFCLFLRTCRRKQIMDRTYQSPHPHVICPPVHSSICQHAVLFIRRPTLYQVWEDSFEVLQD